MIKSDSIIKSMRVNLNLTQKEFAEALGVTQSYISQMETGKVDVSMSLFLSWCSIFKIDSISINIKNKNISYD